MAFSYVPHTADVTLVAQGATLEAAFSEAARAVTHVMTDDEIADEFSVPVHIESESLESLLFDFVDELILFLDTKSLFVHKALVSIANTNGMFTLKGHVHGDVADNYEHHGDVKAPTLHGLAVSEFGAGWELRITLDL